METMDQTDNTTRMITRSKDHVGKPVVDSPLRARKLWCYIVNNLFPGLKISGEDIFSRKLLDKLFEQKSIVDGECHDLEFILRAHEISSKKKFSIDENEEKMHIFQMLQSLVPLYEKFGTKNNWKDAFIFLIRSLDLEMWDVLISQCPLELLSKSMSEIWSYQNITPFELAALGCKNGTLEEESTNSANNQPSKHIDCWFTSDDPDANCAVHGPQCPLSIPPNLSKEGLFIHPKPVEVDFEHLKREHGSILNNLNKPFDPNYFSIPPSPPVSLGLLEKQELFCKWGPVPQPQNIPIKMPFTEYRLPKELEQFEEAVQKVANYWHGLNPEYGDYYYCYMSVGQSNMPPGCFQRRGHLHSDGFQSYWIKPKLFSDFSFIVSNTASTECFLQSFDVSHLDPSKHNYYKYFNKHLTVKPIRLRKPFEIIMMDSYTLHKAIKNETKETLQRTFLRFMFSVIRWERKGNAYNPMFNYKWPTIRRSILRNLT